ncbi:MAG: acetylxylan esterase [Clostridiales bacterium]|nr:acetylxylan esterase [Clostridiales bacterium]
MPLIDMPLAKLREYKGINPKPADFSHENLPDWADIEYSHIINFFKN